MVCPLLTFLTIFHKGGMLPANSALFCAADRCLPEKEQSALTMLVRHAVDRKVADDARLQPRPAQNAHPR
jgi:hypothetical protein